MASESAARRRRPTRLLVFSDLHMEHRPEFAIPRVFPEYDVAVVAGDVGGSPAAAMAGLASEPGLRGRPVVFVPGNHEFYGGIVEDRLAEAKASPAASAVTLLDRGEASFNGVRFLGATLWTDYALHGTPRKSMSHASHVMNDHRHVDVRKGASTTPFRPAHAKARHVADLAWLRARLAVPYDGPTVVVTHHAPCPGSVHGRYLDGGDEADLTPAFVSDLTATVEGFGPDLWVHGHVHDSFDYRVGRTRVLCNPKGYGPGGKRTTRENGAFDEALVVEV